MAAELSHTLFFVAGLLTGLFGIFHVMRKAGLGFKVLKQSKTKAPALRGSARNSAVFNDTTGFQKIETAEIEIPVIAEDVLEYGPGELGESFPEKTRLFYSGEALQDPDYLQTVLRSPLQVQTHKKNTGEHDRDVDGWPVEASWDESTRRVIAKGVVHGAANVQYVKENADKPTFGTSAYISFLKIDRQPGIAPNGKPYDAIVRKAVNNHIAILPNIRDPKNVILAMNAVETENMDAAQNIVIQSGKKYGIRQQGKRNLYSSQGPHTAEDIKDMLAGIERINGVEDRRAVEKLIYEWDATAGRNEDEAEKSKNSSEGKNVDYEEFKGHMNAYEEEKKSSDELVEKVANAVLAKMNSKNADGEKKEEKDAANEDTGKPVEEKPAADEAANALPSDAMVKDFSDVLGITFAKTPTLSQLAAVAGVTGEGPAGLIAALNAKRETFKKEPEAGASNAVPGTKTVEDLIKSF